MYAIKTKTFAGLLHFINIWSQIIPYTDTPNDNKIIKIQSKVRDVPFLCIHTLETLRVTSLEQLSLAEFSGEEARLKSMFDYQSKYLEHFYGRFHRSLALLKVRQSRRFSQKRIRFFAEQY